MNETLYSCKKLVVGIQSYLLKDISQEEVSELFTETAVQIDKVCATLQSMGIESSDLVENIEDLRLSLEKLLELDERNSRAFDDQNGLVKSHLICLVRSLKAKKKIEDFQSLPSTILETSGSNIDLKGALNTIDQFSQSYLKSIENLKPEEILVATNSNYKSISVQASEADSVFIVPLTPCSEDSEAFMPRKKSSKSDTFFAKKRSKPLHIFLEHNFTLKKIEYNGEKSLTALQDFIESKTGEKDFKILCKEDQKGLFVQVTAFSDIKDYSHLKVQSNLISGVFGQKLEEMIANMRLEIQEKVSSIFLQTKLKDESKRAFSELKNYIIQLEELSRKETEGVLSDIQGLRVEISKVTGSLALKLGEKRANLLKEKEAFIDNVSKTEDSLKNLKIVIDGLKQDAINRGCLPNEIMMKALESKLESMSAVSKATSMELSRIKPEWKKLWESELSQIVKEQDFFRDKEATLDEQQEELIYLDNVVESLSKISKMKKRIPTKTSKKVDCSNEETHDMILQEISLLTANSETRLEAIKKNEERKRLERELIQEITTL